MTKPFTGRKRIRKDFGRIAEVTRMPNLIEVQKSSYDQFLQIDVTAENRESIGLQEVFRSVFPIKDFSEKRRAQFVRYELEAAEVRRRGVPAARHDVRRAAEGDAAPGRLGSRRGDRRALDPRHQGAGRLHGRHAPDDRQRHLHRQRHRARHRQPDAPLAGRVLRPRQGQDPLLAASICSPRASFRIAARGSTSSSTPRTSCYVRIDRRRKLPATTLLLALWSKGVEQKLAKGGELEDENRRFERHVGGGDPELLLQPGRLHRTARRAGRRRSSRAHEGREAGRRPGRRQDRQGGGRGRHQDDAAPRQEAAGSRASRKCWCSRKSCTAATSPSTSSTRRPARSSSRPATRSPRRCSTSSRARACATCRPSASTTSMSARTCATR